MISDLAPELVLVILSYLPLPSLAKTHLVSKHWHEFLDTQESAIYRAAAILHKFIPPGHIPLEEAKLRGRSGWLTSVTTWKELCHAYVTVDRTWRKEEGADAADICQYSELLGHRVKIDEEERTILNTSQRGGLTVRCAESGDVLWSLRSQYVRRTAHLEYSNGFLIFDTDDDTHEVWVRKSMMSSDNPNFTAAPTPEQLAASVDREPLRRSSETSSRGVYAPYAVLSNPSPTRAYRFVYPHLLIASHAAMDVHIWDVPSKRLLESFPLKTTGDAAEDEDEDEHDWDEDGFNSIQYVELSDRYVFVCWGDRFSVYTRTSPSDAGPGSHNASTSGGGQGTTPAGKEVFQLPRDFLKSRLHAEPTAFCSLDSDEDVLSTYPINTGRHSNIPMYSLRFSAAHVSPDGRDFVAVTNEGIMFYVRDFGRLVPKLAKGVGAYKFNQFYNTGMWMLRTGISIDNLAFNGERIVFSNYRGVYAISLDDVYSGALKDTAPIMETLPPSPKTIMPFPADNVALVHNLSAENTEVEYEVTSLQMTPTTVFYVRAGLSFLNGFLRRMHAEPSIILIDFSRHTMYSPGLG